MNKMMIALLAALALLPTQSLFANEKGVEKLNELLRGEISAVETYQQALEKVAPTEKNYEPIRQALKNHQQACESLKSEIQAMKATPSTESGAWGAWSQTIVGSAKLIGDETALKALKEGEEHGLKEYRAALLNADVPEKTKSLIRKKLIVRQEEHINSINKLMNKM